MGEYRFWLSAIPKNHQRVGKKMGRQKDGTAKRWDGKKMECYPLVFIFLPNHFFAHWTSTSRPSSRVSILNTPSICGSPPPSGSWDCSCHGYFCESQNPFEGFA